MTPGLQVNDCKVAEAIQKPSNEQVIKEFLTTMLNQDNRGTAPPFFYVIRSKVFDHAPVDNCDKTKWYWQECTYDSKEAILKSCKEHGYTPAEARKALEEAVEYGVRERWEHKGMFLTEDDAEAHLKANHYHYSPDAHTYVDHAWRAPKLTAFFQALFNHFEVRPFRENPGSEGP